MPYTNTEELLELLKKHKLWNKKSLGQNFLVNPQIIEKITTAANVSLPDKILEIGPGLGILTENLLTKANHVRSIELDPNLIPILKQTFEKSKNFELIHADALTLKLPDYPYKLVANIPYYITSPLLNHYLQPKTPTEKRPSLIVLLVQKEVAEKICAREGDHSVLSLQVQIFGKPSIAGYVNKIQFFPQPKVDSAILKIEIFAQPLVENTDLFFKTIKMAFAQKRKTLLNSITNGLKITREATTKIFQNAGIDENRRPQTLTIEEWQKLMAQV